MDVVAAVFIWACIVGAGLLAIEGVLRRRRKAREARLDAEWHKTAEVIRATLAAPERQQVLADVKVRALANQTRLDHICEATATALGAPAAVVTLVEIEGQVWLAHYGAEWCGPDVRAGLIQPLSASYCKYVVTTDDTLVINDSLTDVRVRTADDQTMRNVRAYLGAPVHSREGVTIGSLCVFDHRPRKWTQRDRTTVESFARLVEL